MSNNYKLRCFGCGYTFKSKEEVYRDLNGIPKCEDCMWEYLDDEWDSDCKDDILIEIKTKFNGRYKRFKNWYFENFIECAGDHNYDGLWINKNDAVVIDGKNYCEYCAEEMENNDKK